MGAMAGPRFDPASVAAVVFDIGGVFTYPHWEPMAELLVGLGAAAPEGTEAYRRAHHAGVLALAEAMIAADWGLDDESSAFWAHYDVAYTMAVGVELAVARSLAGEVARRWDWAHEENIAAFHRLAATGMPLAIVSNNDGTAPDQMRDHGVCQVGPGPLPSVAAIVDSATVGVAKPDPAIFTPALDALGVAPERVLYVGDTVHADVEGATRARMQVVQLDPFDHHAGFDHARVADLDALLAQLGL